jgi:hypothetical protein
LDLLNDNFFNSISSYNVTTFHYSLNKGTTMTDNIKELANLPVTLLAVTETNVHLQTESGKGVMTLTSANLGGGGSSVVTVDTSLDMLTCQVLNIGQTSVQSQVVSSTTTKVVLIATIDCWVAYNTNPTAEVATVPSVYLSAGIPSYPLLVNALNTKFAVIAPIGTGKLSLMEYR